MLEHETLNVTRPLYKAIFLKALGNDGAVPYKLKCFSIGIAIYAIGLFPTSVSGTLNLYLRDSLHLLIWVFSGVTFCLVMHVCKQIGPTFQDLNTVFKHSGEDFQGFVSQWNRDSALWYYICVITAVLGTAWGILCFMFFPHVPRGPLGLWLESASGSLSWLTDLYTLFSSIILGLIVGVGFNRMLYCIRVVDDYGKKFIAHGKTDLSIPQMTDQLKPLARLTIKLDIVCTVPLMLAAWGFFDHIASRQRVSYFWSSYVVGLLLILAFLSILPLRHLHKAMSLSKQDAIKMVDEKIREFGNNVREEIAEISLLNDLLTYRDRLKKMHTWPVETELLSRLFLTAVLPIVGGALLQIWFQYLLSQFLIIGV